MRSSVPRTRTAAELAREWRAAPRCVSLGCPVLDACLGGGVYTGDITEIAGEAGAGKTQLALTLLLQAQLPAAAGGLDTCAAFVTTEGEFPVARLNQLMPEHVRRTGGADADAARRAALLRVIVEKAMDVEALWALMDDGGWLPSVLKQKGVRLVVIDSIAALFRGDVDYGVNTPFALGERASWMTRIALRIKALADEFGVAFVLTNQVSASFSSDGVSAADRARAAAAVAERGPGAMLATPSVHSAAQPWAAGFDDALDRRGDAVAHVKPSLGMAWSRLVGTRVMIHRNARAMQVGDSVVRHMRLVFSSRSARNVCSFVVTKDGVRGLGEDEL